ncbi:MAG: hypothetical protein ABR587_02210 [Candidatus Binatia bacterium]
MPRFPVAVVDVGSNSARVVVFRRAGGGVLEVMADEHVSLQLIRELEEDGRLSKAAVARTLRVLRDFRRLADAAGAKSILAFGTAALREARNGEELRARIASECGIQLRIMGPDEEAQAGFTGAVYGLPVTGGLVFDIGGGSLQITLYRNRLRRRACSLPLGALRVSDEFLGSDPPGARQVRKLRKHVAELLTRARIPRLQPGETVVGTGGTVRNLAKLDSRRFDYPIARLHGYELTHGRLRELTSILLGQTAAERSTMSGLNASRADSIVGGAIVAEAILEAGHATRFLVAGQGLREGVVLDSLLARLPTPARVRENAIAVLASRFGTCDATRSMRRRKLALSLYDLLEPLPDPLVREMLGHATAIVDIGRSVDFYRLHAHAASIIRASALLGFSHREIALLSSIVELADKDGWDPRRCSPPLRADDYDCVDRAGVLLCLADVIEQRRLPGRASGATGRAKGRAFVLEEAGLAAWVDEEIDARFRKAFGKDLKVAG